MTVPKLVFAVAWWFLVALPLPCSAEPAPVARLTIVDGDAIVIRAASKSAAPLGLALNAGDIIESSTATHLVRIEFMDRAILDLGPRTRVLLRPTLATRGATPRPLAYVLSGWVKVAAPPSAKASVMAPLAEVLTSGAVVMNVIPQEAYVFAETADAIVVPRGDTPAKAGPVALRAGQFVSAADGAAPRLAPQAPTAWVQGVPVALRDRLPPRLDQFAGANVAPKSAIAVTQTDVEAWLASEPALRKAMRPRWEALSRDADAKEATVRGLRATPEKERMPPAGKVAPPPAAALAPAAPASTQGPAAVTAAATPPAPPTTDTKAERLDVATFADASKSVQGGPIAMIAYSERAGEATYVPIAARNGELQVRGEFVENGQSAWAGVGVAVNLFNVPFDASAYKTLRIRLGAAPGVSSLRVRIVGADKKVQKSGCYPVFEQTVSAQVRAYDIPLSRFVPEGFCGSSGVPASNTLSSLLSVEVADTVRPLAPRAVSFSVGTMSLLR